VEVALNQGILDVAGRQSKGALGAQVVEVLGREGLGGGLADDAVVAGGGAVRLTDVDEEGRASLVALRVQG